MNLEDKLILKLYKEQEEYIERLKTQKPEIIISRSYETATKEDILYYLKGRATAGDFAEEELKTLTKSKNVIEAIYYEYLSEEEDLDNQFSYATENGLEVLSKGLKNKEKERERE